MEYRHPCVRLQQFPLKHERTVFRSCIVALDVNGEVKTTTHRIIAVFPENCDVRIHLRELANEYIPGFLQSPSARGATDADAQRTRTCQPFEAASTASDQHLRRRVPVTVNQFNPRVGRRDLGFETLRSLPLLPRAPRASMSVNQVERIGLPLVTTHNARNCNLRP